jgi:endonuclease/exonuclease/phosphatase (EEP) superfamily protein YafD
MKSSEGISNILIGDFNTLPFQSAIKKIKDSGYKDSYGMLNNSPVGTFGPTNWSPKIFKIDYVFHKGKLKPMGIKRFSICTSDHSGWIADFKLL